MMGAVETPAATELPARRWRWAAILGCLALALGLRLAHLAELRASDPLFETPSVDAQYYDQLGREIAAGYWLADEGLWHHPPGYPYALALVYLATGQTHETPMPERDYWAPRLAQVLLGVGTVLLTLLIAQRLTGSLGWGLAAGLAAACWGPLIYFEGELVPVTLVCALDALALWLLLAFGQRPGSARLWAWAAAGLLLGLSGVARPNALLAAAALGWWGVFAARRAGRSWGSALAGLLVCGLASAAPLLITYTRNVTLTGEPVVLVTKGGFNLYLGNNPDAPETSRWRPGADFYRFSRMSTDLGGVPLADKVGGDRWFMAQLAEHVRQRPLQAGAWLLIKFGRVWIGREETRNLSLYDARAHSRVLWALLGQLEVGPLALRWPMGLLAPLALLGLVSAWRQPTEGAGLLATFLLTYAVSVAIGFTAARYRLPMVPALLPLAALAAQRWLQAPWRARALALALLLPLGWAVNAPSEPQTDHERAEVLYYHARARLRAGDGPGALRALQASIERHPTAYACAMLAHLARDRGRPREAIALLEHAIALDPLQWSTHYSLALRLEHIDPPRARALARQAIALDPRKAEPHLLLADLAADREAKRRHLLAALERRPGFQPAVQRLWRLWEQRAGD